MRKMMAFGVVVFGFAVFAACSSSSNDTGSGASTSTGMSGGLPIGSACTANSDCESMNCSLSDPGGQCLQVCATQADCPAGSTCTDEKKCYKSCTSAADCTRSGYACVDSTTVTGSPTKTCDVAEMGTGGAGTGGSSTGGTGGTGGAK